MSTRRAVQRDEPLGLHERDQGVLARRVGDDIQIEREARVAVGSKSHATNHRNAELSFGQESANDIQFAGKSTMGLWHA